MNLFDKYYYIVYFRDFTKPKLFPVYFTNKNAARRAIRKKVAKKLRAYYEVIKGSKLKDFQDSFLFYLGNLGVFTKYDYPDNLSTRQKRKSFRTRLRRRLRRMGMLTPAKNKYSVRDSPRYIKLIENRQKVAMSPNTQAKAFRLERKSKDIYYLILDKKLSKKRKVLFEVQALQVNMKTKAICTKHVNIYKNDIIIPYLVTEVNKIYGTAIKHSIGRGIHSGSEEGYPKNRSKDQSNS